MDKYTKYEAGQPIKVVKNGDVVHEPVKRDAISEESKKDLINCLEEGRLEDYARKTFEILTGETVEEAKK